MNNYFLKKIKMGMLINILSLIGFFIVATPSLYSKVVSDHYVVEDWLKFEPGEEYTLKGNQFFLTNYSKVGYYKEISDMVTNNTNSNRTGFSDTIPTVFSSVHRGSENVLGVRLSWERLGSHYADIIPPDVNKIKEQGFDSVEEVSIWVWSGNYDHELDLVLSRKSGDQVTVSFGKLNFLGWRQLKAKIPNRAKVGAKAYYLSDDEFYLDRFRVYTKNGEKVGNVYVFLDNFEVKRNIGKFGYYDGKNIVPVIKKELEELEQGEKSDSVDNSGNNNINNNNNNNNN